MSNTDDAIERAAARAEETATRNLESLPGLPLPADTANLRLGPDLHPGLLGLLPLVGVWRGEGVGHVPPSSAAAQPAVEASLAGAATPDSTTDTPVGGDYNFGQQIVIAHDGQNFLSWESRSWKLDGEGSYLEPDLRESGFWRIGEDDTIEFLLAHASGVIELYYGKPLTQTAWELETDVVIRSQSGALVGGAKRLYGLVEGTDLAYVEERINADGELIPRLSARLSRYIG